jgi:chromosomal replication initiation ATPase DnaA
MDELVNQVMSHGKQVGLKRDILNCLNRLNALVKALTLQPQDLTCNDAFKKVVRAMNTTPDKIRVPSNEARIVLKRQICQYVLRTAVQATYPDIALITGIKDHTTVMHSCKKIKAMCEANPEFDKQVRGYIGAALNEHPEGELTA